MTPERMTFPAWHRETPDLPGPASSELFRFLSAEQQAEAWADLGERSEQRIEDELAYERWLEEEWPPPKRRTPHHRTGTRAPAGGVRWHSDPLKRIAAAAYYQALTGQPVSGSGLALCVFHDDRHHPNVQCRGTRWRCWACGAGDYAESGKSGSIIDLGARIWNIEPSGRGYFEIRRRLAEALLAGKAAAK